MKQQQAIQYLAFDVHQATIVANCRDADGKAVMRATVATKATTILQLVRSCGPRAGGLSKREPSRNLWPYVGLNDIF
jgi:hypothetical protein